MSERPQTRPQTRPGRWPLRARHGVVVLVSWLVVGNLVIAGASAWARTSTPTGRRADVPGIGNFRMVDDHLWRGAAPSRDGYRWLAAQGVRTVVDLRAEKDRVLDRELLAELGLVPVAIPIRDGQTPTPEQVDRFLEITRAPGERVFVHCGAGVGRTGTMVASYLVASGSGNGWSALRRNLAVGPPSLEQVAFAAESDGRAGAQRPSVVVVALSRVLDAPRRVLVRLRAR